LPEGRGSGNFEHNSSSSRSISQHVKGLKRILASALVESKGSRGRSSQSESLQSSTCHSISATLKLMTRLTQNHYQDPLVFRSKLKYLRDTSSYSSLALTPRTRASLWPAGKGIQCFGPPCEFTAAGNVLTVLCTAARTS
jgi:hypothetical protein